jgi:hypothetical protein
LGGLGRKDLFIARKTGTEWVNPIPLEPPLNSPADDFGLVTDSSLSGGYFSSSRGSSDDIYSFTTLFPHLSDCPPQMENNYCREFWDDQYAEIDTLPLIYQWEFSDGTTLFGIRVQHCFPGPGKYSASLTIKDTISAIHFVPTTQEFEIVDRVQPYITCPQESSVTDSVQFSAVNSYLPGYTIESYLWDFGDGTYGSGAEVKHHYNKSRNYVVQLTLKAIPEGSSTSKWKCVSREISILKER